MTVVQALSVEKEEQYGENNEQYSKRIHYLKGLCQHFKRKINARTCHFGVILSPLSNANY